MIFLLPLLLLVLPCSSLTNFPVVSTSFGSIRGYEYTNEAGFTSQIFKKLPFAAPPTGDLRWAKPQSPSKWNHTIDGTFFGPACAQKTLMYAGPVTGFSEDCLHLNVYTSEKCRKSSSCAVLFVIHGGLGIYESTMKFPDKTLVNNFVSQDIVVVSTAYRVGAFGIMALGDENALPANLAMHDVLAALKFTRAEIHAFGGDEDRITLMGPRQVTVVKDDPFFAALLEAFPLVLPFKLEMIRANNDYVFYEIYNFKRSVPRLFSGVISMSGHSGVEKEEKQVQRTHLVATKLNCSGTAREIVACMKKKSTDEILQAAFDVQGGSVFNEDGLGGLMIGGELMPIRSNKELTENTQPFRLMMGNTMYEVLDLDNFSTKFGGNYTADMNKVNAVLGVENDAECFQKYLDDRESGEFETPHNPATQALFTTTHLMTRAQAESGGEVYLYEYDYPEHAVHTDDAYFVLGFHEFEMDSNERWLSRVYPRYFANFVNGGRPAPDWYQMKPNLMNYYSVNKNETSGVVPHMKFGFQQEIADYYARMMEYDRRLTTRNHLILNAPVQYH